MKSLDVICDLSSSCCVLKSGVESRDRLTVFQFVETCQVSLVSLDTPGPKNEAAWGFNCRPNLAHCRHKTTKLA